MEEKTEIETENDTLYEIAVEWAVCAVVRISAGSLKDAIAKAEEMTPADAEEDYYIDSSWAVNEEMTEHLNLKEDKG